MSDLRALYSFDIQIDQVESTLDNLLCRYKTTVNQLLQQNEFNWETLVTPLAELDREFNRFWMPVSHLNSVTNTDEIRDTYNRCIPKISAFFTEMGQNKPLLEAIQRTRENHHDLDSAQTVVLDNDIRDFILSGVNLEEAEQQIFQSLSTQLSSLTTKFEENVLDATEAWQKQVIDLSDLDGLPDYAIQLAKQQADAHNLEGYLLTLQIPCYIAVMTYANNRDLREVMYKAYCTRASDQGPNAKSFDNTQVMIDILSARKKLAQLLKFNSYAEYSLATKMIKEPEKVLDFLWELVEKSTEKAHIDKQELLTFAKEELQLDKLNPWDISYCSEKLKQARYQISDQELRPYFPAPKVVAGLFSIVERLFSVTIQPIETFSRWHDDVDCYAVHDSTGEIVSFFYLDLYARSKKRSGAWMNDAQTRQIDSSGACHLPVAFIVCNFNPPLKGKPAQLSHDDVVTLFHEFGHALQLMLTRIDYSGVSGLNGVPWDAVEVCSQFLENWAWQKECMPLISSHVDTNETLPDALFEKMTRARQFQAGIQMIRQLEFALFDFILHMDFDEAKADIIPKTLAAVREKTAVFDTPSYNRFAHSFSHIFAGGYAAGYYSYKWAEVMAADAFSLFLAKGIFDSETSQKFRDTFLAQGGAVPPLQLFIQFSNREPSVNALLKQYGIL